MVLKAVECTRFYTECAGELFQSENVPIFKFLARHDLKRSRILAVLLWQHILLRLGVLLSGGAEGRATPKAARTCC